MTRYMSFAHCSPVACTKTHCSVWLLSLCDLEVWLNSLIVIKSKLSLYPSMRDLRCMCLIPYWLCNVNYWLVDLLLLVSWLNVLICCWLTGEHLMCIRKNIKLSAMTSLESHNSFCSPPSFHFHNSSFCPTSAPLYPKGSWVFRRPRLPSLSERKGHGFISLCAETERRPLLWRARKAAVESERVCVCVTPSKESSVPHSLTSN